MSEDFRFLTIENDVIVITVCGFVDPNSSLRIVLAQDFKSFKYWGFIFLAKNQNNKIEVLL